MKREMLITFFRHIAARETTYGIQNAFRFKAVLSKRKKGSLLPTQYGDIGAGAGAGAIGIIVEPGPVTVTAQKKKAKLGRVNGAGAGADGNMVEPATVAVIPVTDHGRPTIHGMKKATPPDNGAGAGAVANMIEPASVDVRAHGNRKQKEIQTSDLLALEEAKKWGVSGKRRRQ